MFQKKKILLISKLGKFRSTSTRSVRAFKCLSENMPKLQWGTGTGSNNPGFQRGPNAAESSSSWGSGLSKQAGGGNSGGSNVKGQNHNQFQLLSGSARYSDPRSSARQQGTPTTEDARRVVPRDLQQELPQWKLSCYGHNRDGPNDITGDVSMEEARWKHIHDKNVLGKPDHKAAEEFRQAILAKDRELHTLKRAAESGQRLPSLGGPPIKELNPWVESIVAMSPSSLPSSGPSSGSEMLGSNMAASESLTSGAGKPRVVFGTGVGQQKTSGFGSFEALSVHNPFGASQHGSGAVVAPINTFGQQPSSIGLGGFTAAPSQGQTIGYGGPNAFGGTIKAGDFGGVSGPSSNHASSKPAWGSGLGASATNNRVAGSVASGFGQATDPLSTAALFGSTAAVPAGGTSSAPGFYGTAGAASTAAWGAAASSGTQFQATISFSHNPSIFGSSSSSSFNHQLSTGPTTSTVSVMSQEQLEVYRAPSFQRGKIPDEPPPPELCF
ncbi:hypothetical protein CEUSTIGMA_g1975.t1 [Chlamydomonas eustigma]|uniref:Uncharacterized protein n=1 Tax=Chlamydomonas eustigma TaxID=1157962 RepID=A0A250WUU6_9CHLO|nr:hypothetical protein CEUSTIGMA_g1975.t1 [Chlamydomonas eustigma]|eukprot:GAX74526.1 hypothetical protein CEUSTIGMA_g1975.t1 [Chlamydomonas eustigma]